MIQILKGVRKKEERKKKRRKEVGAQGLRPVRKMNKSFLVFGSEVCIWEKLRYTMPEPCCDFNFGSHLPECAVYIKLIINKVSYRTIMVG